MLAFLLMAAPAAGAFGPGAAQTLPGTTVPSAILKDWAEAEFKEIADSCRIKFKSSKSRVPAKVKDLAGEHWEQSAVIYPRSSLNDLFVRVQKHTAEGPTEVLSDRIAIHWGGDPILYSEQSGLRSEQNCVTLLASKLKGDLAFDLGGALASLERSANNTQNQTAFVYAGKMVSPLGLPLELETTQTVSAPGIKYLTAILSVWDWYGKNKASIADGEAKSLYIPVSMEGVAIYRIEGITQESLLKGDASFGFHVPFLGFSASGDGRTSSSTTIKLRNFAVALWQNAVTKQLPSPAEIASLANRNARFVDVAENPKQSNGSEFTYRMDLLDMAEAYCRRSFWGLRESAASATKPRITIDTIEKVPADPSRCRFTLRVVPPATAAAGGQIEIDVTYSSEIRKPDNSAIALTISPTARQFTVADLRSAVTLLRPDWLRYALPATSGPPSRPLELRYIAASEGHSLSGASTIFLPVTIICGSAANQANSTSSQVNATASFDKPSNSLLLKANLPPSLFDGLPAGAERKCTVNGTSLVTLAIDSTTVQIPLPSFEFDAVRDNPPPAPPAPTPALPTDAGSGGQTPADGA